MKQTVFVLCVIACRQLLKSVPQNGIRTTLLVHREIAFKHTPLGFKQLDGFVVGPPPDLSVAMFRYCPTRGNPNEFNQKLIQAIQHDGRIFLSSTKMNGEVFLPLTVLGFSAHLETIELALEILRQKAKEIESNVNF